jgi:hypothetical protein
VTSCEKRKREPLRVDELVGYLREAIEPPTPIPALALEMSEP